MSGNILYIRIAILCIALHILLLKPYSQDNNRLLKDNYYYGEYYMSQNQYREALPFFQSVFDADSINANINYKIGKCYINIRGEKLKSIPYLERASKNIADDYISDKFENDAAPFEALILLGEAYQRNNELEKALQKYYDYMSYLKPKEDENLAMANLKIQSIDAAKQEIRNTMDIAMINLGENINSRFSDYNPVVTHDDSIMFFTSFWESADLIFRSNNINGNWSKPVDITEEIGSPGDCYTSAISGNGKELYLIKQGNYNSDIYVSYFQNDKWTVMEKLNNKVNSNEHETSVSITYDGNTLYFSSNRTGGKGGFDLYKSEKQNGEWGKPVNLGSTINTKYNEEAPCISLDGTILLFSSEGHRNMGGMDIFASTLNKKGEWTEPINLGCPFNTTNDDIFVVRVNQGKKIYISKYDPEGYGKHDILKIEMPMDELIKRKVADLPSDTGSITDEQEYIALYEEPEYKIPEKNYLSDTIKTAKVNEKEEDYKADIPYYTIQVMALKKPIHPGYFENLTDIKVTKGDDAFHRYTHGKYHGYTIAKQELEKVHKLGYNDAFIREINSISNSYEK
jgi:tetratricopeptide (TPR) repeat protein